MKNLNYDVLLMALRDATLWERSYRDSWSHMKDAEAESVRADSTKKINHYHQQIAVIQGRKNATHPAATGKRGTRVR